MLQRYAPWLIVVLNSGLLFCDVVLVRGQVLPGKEEAPSQQPAPSEQAAPERYELPDDPTIPKKFNSPAAFEKWLAEIEQLYVPPKWSEQPKLSELQRDKLEIQRDSAFKKAKDARNVDELLAQFAVILQFDRQLHGPESERVLDTLQSLSATLVTAGEWQAAIHTQQQICELTTKVYGPQSYLVKNAKQALTTIDLLQELTTAERQQYQESKNVNKQAKKLFDQGKYSTALPLAQTVFATLEKLLGSDHPDTATPFYNLAELYRNMGDYARAEPLFTRAIKINEKNFGADHPETARCMSGLGQLCRSLNDYARADALYSRALKNNLTAFGPDHPNTAMSLNNLAGLYESLGDYALAKPLLIRALSIHEKARGSDHPDTAASLNSLALLYDRTCDYARAEPLYNRALKIREKALGPDHPDTAYSVNNLAAFYNNLGDLTRAEALYSRALKIKEKVLEPDHPSTALSLNNLATVYLQLGDYARAEPLLTRALQIKEKALGPDHPETANALGNLAVLYDSLGDSAKSESLAIRALKIRENALGPDHPNTATSLNNLAELYRDLGDDARAEPLHIRALKIREKTLGPDHPDTAESLKNLGYLHLGQRQPRLALPRFERAFQIELKQFQTTLSIQSERQQREFAAQFQINGYLQTLLATEVPITEHYARLMLRKGLVFCRQQALRSVRDNPQLEPVFTDWQRTLTQLSQAAQKSPLNEQERENLQTRVNELTTRKEVLETQLARVSQEFAAAQQTMTVAELQAALPKNAVLIDYMVYGHFISANAANKTKATWEARIAAFIIPAQGEVQLLDLGLAAPVDEQLALWLGPERSDLGKSKAAQTAGVKLRQQLWEPLTKYLPPTSTGEVPLVLLSPDEVLNQIPWNALPGAKPATYLLEEAAITIIPVPQMLPGLLNPVTPRMPPGKLLVLGDVDYDQVGKAPSAVPKPAPEVQIATVPSGAGPSVAVPRSPVKRDADAVKFAKLPGTQGELATLEKLCRETFGAVGLTKLQQQAASKAAVQQAAPQHAYLHLATHGFFAADNNQKLIENKPGLFFFQSGDRSLLSSINPNLLSGIVLAGANVPQAEDDGILTAEEVLGLELRGVQLTTLSACETGMGTTTSGEGLLGLQRAFQVAGCQTVVASQWSVDDAATRALMERFYTNMWVKKLPKLVALREAQLWMLREGPKDGIQRGLAREGLPANDKTGNSPYYWAPFILSGDWR